MTSPFPGMNPYLERADVWSDFHNSFIPLAREILAIQVQPRYYIRIAEHLFIHEPSPRERFPLGRPDISIHPKNPQLHANTNPGTAVAAPASVGMPVLVEEQRLPFLEIRDRSQNEAVTILESLSPTKKATEANREQYLAKIQRILASRTNLVEIDLLRGGPRMPWDRLKPCDYYVIVSRHENRVGDHPADLWPFFLRHNLQPVPIPLRPGDVEPLLDIQAMIHRIYDAAGYQYFIYDSPPEPVLTTADATWAARILETAPV